MTLKRPPPPWCTKKKPCDFDPPTAYCPHRECRSVLLLDHGVAVEALEAIAGGIPGPCLHATETLAILKTKRSS